MGKVVNGKLLSFEVTIQNIKSVAYWLWLRWSDASEVVLQWFSKILQHNIENWK